MRQELVKLNRNWTESSNFLDDEQFIACRDRLFPLNNIPTGKIE